MFAPAQIGTSQGVGIAQVGSGAIKHDLPTALTGTRPHVNHAVGGHHHCRVVLDHDERVARVAQAVHGQGDAVHVSWVQADAGLVEHEQGVDEAGAQGGGEVDALHFAAAERAALAVEGEVTNAHVTQVFEASGDFFEEQLQGFLFGAWALVRGFC